MAKQPKPLKNAPPPSVMDRIKQGVNTVSDFLAKSKPIGAPGRFGTVAPVDTKKRVGSKNGKQSLSAD